MSNKQNNIGIGIVGLGWVSNQYIKSFINNKFCNIVAFCDINVAKAEKIKEKYNLPECKVYENFDDMLDNLEVKVVCIFTPNFDCRLFRSLFSSKNANFLDSTAFEPKKEFISYIIIDFFDNHIFLSLK